MIDFDVGLRNLDLVMGCERRVVFDFINVINGDANLNQALIRDKRIDNLYIFPTSQTRDKEALKREGVERVMEELTQASSTTSSATARPASSTARLTALYFADSGDHRHQPRSLFGARQRPHHRHSRLASRAAPSSNETPVEEHLLLTRYSPERVKRGEMLSVEDVKEILSVPLLGVIPESEIGAERVEHRHAGHLRPGEPGRSRL